MLHGMRFVTPTHTLKAVSPSICLPLAKVAPPRLPWSWRGASETIFPTWPPYSSRVCKRDEKVSTCLPIYPSPIHPTIQPSIYIYKRILTANKPNSIVMYVNKNTLSMVFWTCWNIRWNLRVCDPEHGFELAGSGEDIPGDVSQTARRERGHWGPCRQGPRAAQARTCDHSDASQMDRQSWPSQLCTGDGRGTGQ